MKSFQSKVLKIGINPYVLIPGSILNELFNQSGKDKGPIPVKGTLNGKKFIQTLVKYSGKWRLYLNTPMRKAAGIDVGDMPTIKIEFDPKPRSTPMHPKLLDALAKNKDAAKAFKGLTPYRQKEIMRYLNSLKSEQSVDKNIEKVMLHLSGKESFAGRNSPN